MKAEHDIKLEAGKLVVTAKAEKETYLEATLEIKLDIYEVLEKIATESKSTLDDKALPWVKMILASLEKSV